MPRKVKCPFCKRKDVYHRKDGTYDCRFCKGRFDDNPSEGGTYFTDPTKRLEREERSGRPST